MEGKVRIAGRWSEREIRNCQGCGGTGREPLTGRMGEKKVRRGGENYNIIWLKECEAAGWRAEIMGL